MISYLVKVDNLAHSSNSNTLAIAMGLKSAIDVNPITVPKCEIKGSENWVLLNRLDSLIGPATSTDTTSTIFNGVIQTSIHFFHCTNTSNHGELINFLSIDHQSGIAIGFAFMNLLNSQGTNSLRIGGTSLVNKYILMKIEQYSLAFEGEFKF